jgi:hypothetical protein
MKKIIGIIAALALLAGCSESTIEKVDTSATTQTSTASQTTNTPEIFQVGDTVKFDNLKITLNAATEVKEAEFLSPDNDKFLVIDMTIENVGDQSEAVSTLLQIELMDADSYTYTPTIYIDAKGSVDGEVAPGRKMRGEVAFDVPDSDYYEFIFSDPFTTGQAIWRIERSDIGQ